MKATGFLAAMAAGAVALLAAASPAMAEPSVQIDSVSVGPSKVELTLTTSDLRSAAPLDPADVTVTAGGVTLPVEVTSRGKQTKVPEASSRSVVVLLDTSGSMSDADMAAARRAAVDYARSLPGDVRVGLVTFADDPELVMEPTADRGALADALATLRPGGNTALYDAVTLGVSTLDKAGGGAQRRLVILSDGVDTSSATTLDKATALLAAEDVAADVVAFRYDSGETSGVQQLTDGSGGKVLAAADASQLSAAFTAMARSFTETALIAVNVPAELAGKSVVLDVTVASDGAVLSATRRVTFATAPAVPRAPAASGSSWWPTWSWQLWALLGLTFTTVLALVLAVVTPSRGASDGKRAVDRITRYAQGGSRAQAAPQEGSAARTAVAVTEQVLRARGWDDTLGERLDLAGMSLKPADWTLLRIAGGAALIAVLVVLDVHFLLAVPIGAALAWAATAVWVNIKIGRRRAAFSDQLPDVLQLVAGSLQSGFSLAQALDAVVREDTQPSAGEFSRALAETRIGVELEDALDKIALRMRSDDLRWIVMAIRIQREVGGNLAEVLLTTVATMRERAHTRRQVRALSAEGRLSAYVLIALPIGIGSFFFLTNPEYMRPLHTTGVGIVMLVVAALLVVVGMFWMRKLVKVEV